MTVLYIIVSINAIKQFLTIFKHLLVWGFGVLGVRQNDQTLLPAMRRELREETGIQPADIDEQFCLGVVYDVMSPHGELCFLTRLNISLAEAHQRVPEDNEIQHLLSLYVTKESLREVHVDIYGNISATGEPNLLMYGALKFGERWFEEVMEYLNYS